MQLPPRAFDSPAGIGEALIVGSKVTQMLVRLVAINYAARGTNLYTFATLDGAPLPATEPGAHITLHLPSGLERQYSLIRSDESRQSYQVAVKLDAATRGGSAFVHKDLRVGDEIPIKGPENHFPLHFNAPYSVFVAGGIGITPIWCMIQKLEALGQPYELHYASRTRSEAAFLSETAATGKASFHFDDEEGGRVLDIAGIIKAAPRDAHVYCCGPAPMLRAFEAATKEWPEDQVHVEYFMPKEERATDGGFVVALNRSKKEFRVPKGKTILDVLEESGISVPASCEQGVCGTCETRVISGIPDHRDSILTPKERAENKTMFICCSGSKSDRLVLDL